MDVFEALAAAQSMADLSACRHAALTEMHARGEFIGFATEVQPMGTVLTAWVAAKARIAAAGHG